MIRRTLVKICGVRTLADARAAVAAGADALGLNFAPGSPRRVAPEFAREVAAALPREIQLVAVTVDAPDLAPFAACQIQQLHGAETPAIAAAAWPAAWKAFRWRGAETGAEIDRYFAACGARPPAALLLDTYRADAHGGTGATWDWTAAAARAWPAPLILAGGLHAGNVGAAVAAVRPWMVDVASGVEDAPGVKSAEKMRAFVAAVRAADQ